MSDAARRRDIPDATDGQSGDSEDQAQWPVIVAGAGPVGACIALELGRRGISTLVIEPELDATTNPRCNTTNARSMEYFRRMGVAETIRRAGLPLEHPTDVVYCTAVLQEELTRFEFSSAAEVLAGTAHELTDWPTPEPQHRISQIYLEPILHAELDRLPSVMVDRGAQLVSAVQNEGGVDVTVRDIGTGKQRTMRGRYLVGADGGASTVRRVIGAQLEGDGKAAEERVSVYFRSAELGRELAHRKPGWMYWWYGQELRGSFLQLNGSDLFLCHARVPEGVAPEDVHEDDVLLAAIGRPIDHEKLQVIRWTPRRLIADRFRSDRILLAGDAAHLWLPLGGFGMNTGIADAVGLGWRLAAIVTGWADERVLDDYEAERRSVGEATSRAALKIDRDMKEIGRDTDFHSASERGVTLREEAGRKIQVTDRQQWYSQGVQFGSRYVDSDGISGAVGGMAGPAIGEIGTYVPSAEPGSRFPHAWLRDGTSVFDVLGDEMTLVIVGDVSLVAASAPMVQAAQGLGVPLAVLDLTGEDLAETYGRQLVLVRPDLVVAWSGDSTPDQPVELLCDLLGRARVAHEKAVAAS